MRILDVFLKLIYDGQWHIAYKTTHTNAYALVEIPNEQWVADPFVCEFGNQHFIFVEQYIKKKLKGCIGYFEFKDGLFINKGIIIENTYHMSYPDVFEYNNHFYMIPESSANSTVDLYVAERFPDKWKKVKSLIEGKKYVDSTVYYDGRSYYLISYSMVGGYEIHVFVLDMEKLELKFLSKKRYKKNVARPGGRLFVEDGKLMRPAQDCSRKYGEALIIYAVDDLNRDGEYLEHEVRRITTSQIKIENDPERIHHLTSDGLFEIIDVYKEKIDLLHIPKIYIRSRRK